MEGSGVAAVLKYMMGKGKLRDQKKIYGAGAQLEMW